MQTKPVQDNLMTCRNYWWRKWD